MEVTEAGEGEERTFSSFGLDNRLYKAVCKLNYTQPTLVQWAAIPLALQGKDILARAKTGTGKTATYILPILQQIIQQIEANTNKKSIRALVLVPSIELCQQVHDHFRKMTLYLPEITLLQLSRALPAQVQRKRLAELPDIIISTPTQLLPHLRDQIVNFKGESPLGWLVLDEADLLLSFGYSDDIKEITNYLPTVGCQSFLMSATLASNEDLDQLKHLILRNPAVLKLEEAEQSEEQRLGQFSITCPESDKFLITIVLLKLRLLRGKIIFFVRDLDSCYRLKLFLERFCVKSTVLNSELPQNSRSHILAQFNKGIFDYLIATDERFFAGDNLKQKKAPNSKKDAEYLVSRGVDFNNVAAVVNFDLPQTKEEYVHRIGRTARGGATGVSITFVTPEDEPIMEQIREHFTQLNVEIKPYKFATETMESFRYRVADATRSVTRAAIRDARVQELKMEMLNSAKLKTHFEDNPRDLAYLKHDQPLQQSKQVAQLKTVPDYLVKTAKSSKKINSSVTSAPEKKRKKRHRKMDPLKTFTVAKQPAAKRQKTAE